ASIASASSAAACAAPFSAVGGTSRAKSASSSPALRTRRAAYSRASRGWTPSFSRRCTSASLTERSTIFKVKILPVVAQRPGPAPEAARVAGDRLEGEARVRDVHRHHADALGLERREQRREPALLQKPQPPRKRRLVAERARRAQRVKYDEMPPIRGRL